MPQKSITSRPHLIHIAFNSREDRRITDPILLSEPHRFYYFTAHIKATGQNDENMDFFHNNVELLRKSLPSLEIIQKQIDYTDYIAVVQELSRIINVERKEDGSCQIYMNIGSGSKITAIAAAEAARLWGCKIFYVYSAYDPDSDGPLHRGKMILITPPVFPAQKPERELIEILRIIDDAITEKYSKKEVEVKEKYLFKKRLLELLKSEEYLTLKSKHEVTRSRTQAYYGKMRPYLNTLENELGYIRVDEKHRKHAIFLTETGKNVLQIFKYRL